MSTLVTVSKTRLADANAISLLSRTQIEHGLPPRWSAKNVARVLRQSETNAYSLFCNEQLSGFTIASFGDQRMHLMLHAIAPTMLRRGLGRKLLQWQIDAALVAGITEATLEVRADNVDAQSFYQKLDFQPHKVIPRYYSNREDAVRMRRAPLYRANA
ncbi:MAG: GNAT family N-acetyltransferase [Granulosicoccus sp.]